MQKYNGIDSYGVACKQCLGGPTGTTTKIHAIRYRMFGRIASKYANNYNPRCSNRTRSKSTLSVKVGYYVS
jgi:hypothetical protein